MLIPGYNKGMADSKSPSIHIERETHEFLRELSFKRNTPMSQLVENAIRHTYGPLIDEPGPQAAPKENSE